MPGKGDFLLTGQLGDVTEKESAQTELVISVLLHQNIILMQTFF